MKIRIKGNSIRFRLTQTEIKNFEKTGQLEERTEFPNGLSFAYRLERKAGVSELEASLKENIITLFVPVGIANEWTTSDIIGYDHKMKIVGDKELFLLIEKDFVCLDHTLEDQSDNYPNPNKACSPG